MENEHKERQLGSRQQTLNLTRSIRGRLDLSPLDLDSPFLGGRPTGLADTKAEGWIFILVMSTPLPSLSEQ